MFYSSLIAIAFVVATINECYCYHNPNSTRRQPPINTNRSRSSSSSSSSRTIDSIRSKMHTSVDAEEDKEWESINALTLFTNDMGASCLFYKKLGLYCTFGGNQDSMFSTFSNSDSNTKQGNLYINLEFNKQYKYEKPGWGRCVFHVNDVDVLYQKAIKAGLQPEFAPTDADWGERYFHILDPMGNEISLAKRIGDHPRWN